MIYALNPLYVNEIVTSLSVSNFCLKIWNPKDKRIVHLFKPRGIEFDSIIIQRHGGSISFAAIDWLIQHAISLTLLDWKGNIIAQILPEEPASPQLRIAQSEAYLDRKIHTEIVKTLVQTKIERQRDFLNALSPYFSLTIPELKPIQTSSLDFIRNIEARYATKYFEQYAILCRELGYDFRLRRSRNSNMHANDLVNCLLNFGYGVLKVYIRRAINSVGLDNSISFLHFISKGEHSLAFDLMELWRTNIDYSVFQTLEDIKENKGRRFAFNDEYEAELSSDTAKLLLQNIRFNLSLEEIIVNSRMLAKFILKENNLLSFKLNPIEVKRQAPILAKELIKSRNYRELGMNKSTLWYQKKRLEQTGSVRIYNKTKQYLA